MAFSQNDSDEEVVSGGARLFTGISNFNVVAVNPTLEELHALGLNFQQEPKYTVDFGQGEMNKVVFWLSNEDTKISLEFLMTPGPWKSQNSNKYKWLNAKGQDTWAEMRADGSMDTNGVPQWFDTETAYICPRGVDDVTGFIAALANVETGGDCKFDNPDALANGDVTELKALIQALSKNRVRCLAYVAEQKYNRIYSRHFGRIKPQRDDLFVKAINKEYGAIKGDHSIEWKQYVPGVVAPSAVSAPSAVPTDDDYQPVMDDLDPIDDLPL